MRYWLTMAFTVLYLTRSVAPYTPPTIRGAWDQTAGAVTHFLDTVKAGGGEITALTIAETNASPTWDVLLYRGVSGPLAAQTLSGTLNVIIGVGSNSASADFYWHLHAYVTQGDSDTPRGTLINDYVENTTNEWPGADDQLALQAAQAISLAVSDGDRIVVELGLIARNSVATSFSGTMRYGTLLAGGGTEAADATVGGSVTTGAGHLVFSVSVDELGDPSPQRVSQVVTELGEVGEEPNRVSQVVAEVGSDGAAANRVSQLTLEVAAPSSTSPQRVSQIVLEVASPMTPAVFTLAGAQAGREGPILKIRIYDPVQDEWIVASVNWVQDPATYWGGFAEASLLRIDDIGYAASDRAGPLQPTALRFEMSDVPHEDTNTPRLRTWLGQRRALRRCEIWMEMISDRDRRARLVPITVFRGYIEEYEGLDDFRMAFDCLGWINRVKDRPILPHTIGDLFPEAPIETRNQRLPLALGRLSDEGSSEDPPVFVNDEAGRGGEGGAEPRNSFGDLAVAAPTGVSAVEGGGGDLDADDFFNAKVGIQVTRIVGGVEGNSSNFDPEPGVAHEVTLSGSNKSITVTCDDDGADAYRFYLGSQPASPGGRYRFHHYIETTDPVTGVTFTEKELTPGGVQATNPRLWVAAVWVFPDGRTAPAGIQGQEFLTFSSSPGYKRPIRYAFTPPPVGATHGELYGTLVATQAPTRRWTIDVANLNGNGDVIWEWDFVTEDYEEVDGIPIPEGKVPPIYVGQPFASNVDGNTDWHAWVLSGRPVKTIHGVYVGGQKLTNDYFTTQVAAPGLGFYNTKFGPNLYRTITVDGVEYRVPMIFIIGPLVDRILGIDQEAEDFRVNLDGLEDAGDSTGAVVTSGYQQFKVLMKQLGLPDAPSLAQPFNQEPAFSDGTPKLDEDAIDAAEADAGDVVPAGADMARWLASDMTVGDLIAEWCLSARARSHTPESGQLGVSVTNPNGAPEYHIVEAEEVIRKTFRFRDRVQGYGQIVPYAYNPRYAADGSFEFIDDGDERSATAIDESGDELTLPLHGLAWRLNQAAARQVAKSLLREAEYLPREVDSESVLHWLTEIPLGKRVSITDKEGPVAGGWNQRIVQVLGKRLSPTGFRVALTGLDLRRNVGDLTTFDVENLMATEHAGGSRIDSLMTEGAVTVFPNWIPITVNWDAIPTTHGKRLRAYLATDAGTIAARAYVLGDTITTIATTPTHNSTTLTEKEVQIPRPASSGEVRYWILPVLAGGATAAGAKGICYVETYEL